MYVYIYIHTYLSLSLSLSVFSFQCEGWEVKLNGLVLRFQQTSKLKEQRLPFGGLQMKSCGLAGPAGAKTAQSRCYG